MTVIFLRPLLYYVLCKFILLFVSQHVTFFPHPSMSIVENIAFGFQRYMSQFISLFLVDFSGMRLIVADAVQQRISQQRD